MAANTNVCLEASQKAPAFPGYLSGNVYALSGREFSLKKGCALPLLGSRLLEQVRGGKPSSKVPREEISQGIQAVWDWEEHTLWMRAGQGEGSLGLRRGSMFSFCFC